MDGSSSHYRKLVAKKEIDFRNKGILMKGIVRVYQNYTLIMGIPIFPFRKTYEFEIPQTGEYFTSGPFSKMPKEFLEICKKVENKGNVSV